MAADLVGEAAADAGNRRSSLAAGSVEAAGVVEAVAAAVAAAAQAG